MAQAKLDGRRAAKAEQARIEAAAREAWKSWLEDKKQRVESRAKKIIAGATAKAAEIIAAATGEYVFFLKWMSEQKYKSGTTFLEAAWAAYRYM